MSNIFLQKSWEDEARILVPYFFLFFKKDLNQVKQVVSTLVLIYFASPQRGHIRKTSWMSVQTFDPKISLVLIFYSLGIVSPAYFEYDFSRKVFLMLYTINRPRFHCLINSISRDIRQYMYCYLFPNFGVINFEININLLIKPFSHMTQNFRTKI